MSTLESSDKTREGCKLITTCPEPPWTREDGRKVSDYFFKGPQITLNSGIEINLMSLKQHLAYSSMIEGIPWGPKYEWLIKQEVRWFSEESKKYGEENPAFIVIKPVLINLPFPDSVLNSIHAFYKREPVSIGRVACRGYFEHPKMVREEDKLGSSGITVIWFQEEFMSPMPEYVIEKIKEIDWEALAENFEW